MVKQFTGNIDDIVQEYLDGATQKELQGKYSIGSYKLKNEINRLATIRRKGKSHLVDKDLIIKLYLEGNSSSTIAKNLLVSSTTILNYLKEANIAIKDDYLFVRQYNINDNYFETIDTKDKAYWVGWMFGDGFVTRTNSFGIGLQTNDSYILDKFANALNAETYNNFYIPSNNSNRVEFTSKQICQDLAKYGVIPNKSLQLVSYLPEDKTLISHFIRGVFDADGSIGFIKGKKSNHNKSLRFRICGGSYSFLETIRDYLVINLNIPENKITKAKNKTLWNIEYGGNPICRTIYEWLYKDCGELYLVRKKKKYDEFIKTYTSIIDSNYTSTKQLTQTRTKLVNLYIKEHKEFILDKLQEQEPNTTRHALRIWVNRYLKKLMIIN